MRHYYSDPVRLILKALKFGRVFEAASKFSVDELRAYQLHRLQEIVSYAYQHVPYYRKAYSKAGFEPGDLKSLEDFESLPYLTKEIIRRGDPDDFLSDDCARMGVSFLKTSGTTGVPVQYGFDLDARAAAYAVVMKAFSQAGYRIGSCQLLIKESHYSTQPFTVSRLTNRVAVNAYMLSKANVAACEEVLRHKCVRHIWAHPNALLEFATSCKDPHGIFRGLRGVTVMSEPLTDGLRMQLENVLGAKVYNFYGNKEGTVVGYETTDDDFVLAEWFAFNEIIPESADNLQRGEIVGTSFYNRGMPLIRYRMADVVELQCSDIGRSYRKIVEVAGRTSEALTLPDGNKVRIFNLSKSNLANVKMFQIVQESLSKTFIDVVPVDKTVPVDGESMAGELSRYMGNEVLISVRIVEALRKTPTGKTPRVISDIKI